MSTSRTRYGWPASAPTPSCASTRRGRRSGSSCCRWAALAGWSSATSRRRGRGWAIVHNAGLMAVETRPGEVERVRDEERLFGGDLVWWLLLLLVSVPILLL